MGWFDGEWNILTLKNRVITPDNGHIRSFNSPLNAPELQSGGTNGYMGLYSGYRWLPIGDKFNFGQPLRISVSHKESKVRMTSLKSATLI